MIDTTRPKGQPGTAWFGDVVSDRVWHDDPHCVGLSYPAVQDSDTLWLWSDGQWIESPGYEDWFDAGPDWQADCPHEHGAPWRTCDSEAACIALKREEGCDD